MVVTSRAEYNPSASFPGRAPHKPLCPASLARSNDAADPLLHTLSPDALLEQRVADDCLHGRGIECLVQARLRVSSAASVLTPVAEQDLQGRTRCCGSA